MARGSALAGAVAVALLAVSGAGGAAVQTPKRGGTVVFGAGAEPTCLSPVDASCAQPGFLEKVLEPAFALAPDSTQRPRLVSSVTYTKTPPFTVTLGIHPAARWSDGVPVTARDFVFTHDAIVEHSHPSSRAAHRLARSVRRGRREDRESRPPLPLRPIGAVSSTVCAEARAQGPRPRKGLARRGR